MEQPQLSVSRETLLGFPPKVRNSVSWGVAEDGTQNTIVAVRSFSRGEYTYVVFHGLACLKDGVRHMISVARFHGPSFFLPKMHHTVLVVVPDDARVDAFDVSWSDNDTAHAMVRLDNGTTYFYPILIDAVYLDLPVLVRGNTGVVKASFQPIAPAEIGKGAVAFYGMDASSSKVCVLSELRGKFSPSNTTALSVNATTFRLSPANDLLFFSLRNGGIARFGQDKKIGINFSLPSDVDEGLYVKDVCVLPKTVTADDAGMAVLLGSETQSCTVMVTIHGEWQKIVLPAGEDAACIFAGQDGCVYVGTTTAAVHRYAVHNNASPMSTQRFPSWVSPAVCGIADGPNGRLFVAVDGVLWQTDREVEAQGPRTLLRYGVYVALVFVLFYLTLFIGM